MAKPIFTPQYETETEYESYEQAARIAMLNSGKSTQKIAGELYPHLSPASAVARLHDVLNPDNHKKHGMYEEIHFCRVTGRYDTVFFLCDQIGIPRPTVKQEAFYVPKKRK